MGDTFDIAPHVIIEPENATDKSVTYSHNIDDGSITLDDNGKITALQPNPANHTVTVTTNDGSNLHTNFIIRIYDKD